MNVKSFFVTEESRKNILNHYKLPITNVPTPTLYEHGMTLETEAIPMYANSIRFCIQQGLYQLNRTKFTGDLFSLAFSQHFPNLPCYWDKDRVLQFCRMMSGHENDMGFVKKLVEHIYNNFIDDHHHTVATAQRGPQITLHEKYYVLNLHERDYLHFQAERVELFLPLIGVGTYFTNIPEGLNRILLIVPSNNTIPDSILRKRLEYCNRIPPSCKVEVIKE